jgi:hypothetical protein
VVFAVCETKREGVSPPRITTRKPFAHSRIRWGEGGPPERMATAPGSPRPGEYVETPIAARTSQRPEHRGKTGGRQEEKEKDPELGTRGLHSEGGGGRGLTAWDAVC